jgi:hypothetical protein
MGKGLVLAVLGAGLAVGAYSASGAQQVERRERAEAETAPRSQSPIVDTTGDPNPQMRTMMCSETCRVGKRRTTITRTCSPYVAEGYPPLPKEVSTRTVEGPRCVTGIPMVIINPKSPNCWISKTSYCRYTPPGKVGYPCACGAKSGVFS